MNAHTVDFYLLLTIPVFLMLPNNHCSCQLYLCSNQSNLVFLHYHFLISSSSEEEDEIEQVEWSDGDVSDGDVSWADLAKSYRNQLKAARKKAKAEGGGGGSGDETESDTATIGASDADCETDTETEMDADDSK